MAGLGLAPRWTRGGLDERCIPSATRDVLGPALDTGRAACVRRVAHLAASVRVERQPGGGEGAHARPQGPAGSLRMLYDAMHARGALSTRPFPALVCGPLRAAAPHPLCLTNPPIHATALGPALRAGGQVLGAAPCGAHFHAERHQQQGRVHAGGGLVVPLARQSATGVAVCMASIITAAWGRCSATALDYTSTCRRGGFAHATALDLLVQ